MAGFVQPVRRISTSSVTEPEPAALPKIQFENIPEFQLSEDSKHVIKTMLMTKTAESNGVMSVDELGDCLEAFGFNPDDEDVDFLQKHFDDNGDGELEVTELINNIDVLNWHSFYGKDLMREFLRIDTDRDGVIRYPEMLRMLTTRGPEPLSPIDARRLLDALARRFDANFDGKFSYAEFVKIYMSDALPYRDTLGQPTDSEDDTEDRKPKPAPKKKPAAPPAKRKSLSRLPSGSLPSGGSGDASRAANHTPTSSRAANQTTASSRAANHTTASSRAANHTTASSRAANQTAAPLKKKSSTLSSRSGKSAAGGSRASSSTPGAAKTSASSASSSTSSAKPASTKTGKPTRKTTGTT